MNSSIAENVGATTDGTKEEKSSVRVTDKRGVDATAVLLEEARASVALDGETQSVASSQVDTRYEENMKVELEPEVVNPIDALMERTFNFIISQPEWYAVLQMPRGARKELGKNFGKLLTRFPHFNKLR